MLLPVQVFEKQNVITYTDEGYKAIGYPTVRDSELQIYIYDQSNIFESLTTPLDGCHFLAPICSLISQALTTSCAAVTMRSRLCRYICLHWLYFFFWVNPLPVHLYIVLYIYLVSCVVLVHQHMRETLCCTVLFESTFVWSLSNLQLVLLHSVYRTGEAKFHQVSLSFQLSRFRHQTGVPKAGRLLGVLYKPSECADRVWTWFS